MRRGTLRRMISRMNRGKLSCGVAGGMRLNRNGTRRLILGILKYPVAYGERRSEALKPKRPKCFYDGDTPLIERVLNIFSESDQPEFPAPLHADLGKQTAMLTGASYTK